MPLLAAVSWRPRTVRERDDRTRMVVLEVLTKGTGMAATRERMIEATAELLRRRGVAGTSFTDVLRDSAASRGVIYHHFPGGKEELARAAVEWTGEQVRGRLDAPPAPGATAAGVVDEFLVRVRPAVLESAEGASCAIAAATAEGRPGSELQAAARGAFESWVDVLVVQLTRAGVDPEQAAGLAALMVIVLEGAHVLCRAERSAAPFDAAAATIRSFVAS